MDEILETRTLELEMVNKRSKTDTALAVIIAFVLIFSMIFFLLGQWIAAAAMFVVFLALLMLPWLAEAIRARKDRLRKERE